MSEKGAGVLLREPPILEIDDQKYPMRRLGLLDIDRLTVILRKATKSMDKAAFDAVAADGDGLSAPNPSMYVGFLSEFLPVAFDEVVAFLASIIGLDPGVPFEVAEKKAKSGKTDPNEGTIRDPNVFPASALPLAIEKLAEHPQVVDFFAGSKSLGAKLKTLIGPLSAPSTESKPDTDGQTNTSSDED